MSAESEIVPLPTGGKPLRIDPVVQAIIEAYECGAVTAEEIKAHIDRTRPEMQISLAAIHNARLSPAAREAFRAIVEEGSLEARLKVSRLVARQADKYLELLESDELAIPPKDFVRLAQSLQGPQTVVYNDNRGRNPFE